MYENNEAERLTTLNLFQKNTVRHTEELALNKDFFHNNQIVYDSKRLNRSHLFFETMVKEVRKG